MQTVTENPVLGHASAANGGLASVLLNLRRCTEAFLWFETRGRELLEDASTLSFDDWQELQEKAEWLFHNFSSDHVSRLFLAILDRGTIGLLRQKARGLDDGTFNDWFRRLCFMLELAHGRKIMRAEEYRQRLDFLAHWISTETPQSHTLLRFLAGLRHPDDPLAQELYLKRHID